jgi:hypothetical protein
MREAPSLMRLGRRQAFRLARAYAQRSPGALVSRKRGRPGNRAYPTDLAMPPLASSGSVTRTSARRPLKPVHQPLYRCDCLGELIQIDGSEHLWFEGREPRCPLLVNIEDATSRLMHLQFAFYSDKHGVVRVNRKDAIGGDGMTQFGRALHALNIDIICANSSQAKGRVERANGTLQDRLVKETGYPASILSCDNAFLPAFMEKYNAALPRSL